jgi:protein TonB
VANRASLEGHHPYALPWGAAVAILLHALLALGLALVPAQSWQGERTIAVEINERPPPPPEPLPPPPEPPPPPPERTPVVRRPRLPAPPPMPNQEVKPAEPTEEPVQAVFGVTGDSVVEGGSPVAVPVGNTLMTKDRTLAKAPPPPLPPAPPPPPAFAPVDEDQVAEFPEATVKPEPVYPQVAQRMGIGGKVRLRVGIDRRGNVKSVRVLEKAGYGMDEEAVRVVWQYKFKPAKRPGGEPVDFVITYNFTFRSPTQ